VRSPVEIDVVAVWESADSHDVDLDAAVSAKRGRAAAGSSTLMRWPTLRSEVPRPSGPAT